MVSRDQRRVPIEERSFAGTALPVRSWGGAERPKGQFTHGLPGSYSRGCRCDDCRTAWRVWARTRPKKSADSRTRHLAATWVRLNHPKVWAALKDQARRELES